MNSSLHTVNASMIISWLVIAGLFLLVIFQYREVTRYRRRFNRLLGERLGPDGQARVPHSTQSWFVGELMLPVILLDTAKARVLSISPGAREWMAGLGVYRPETFIERQLADNDGENLSFRELKEQLSLRHGESVSFIDQVELVDDVGRTRRLAINVTSSATLERHHAAREVQARVQSLERQALFDHLTGLYSRGKTEEAMRQAIAHAQRYKTPLALAMFDIDLKPCTPPRKPGATGWWRTPVQVTGRLRLDVR